MHLIRANLRTIVLMALMLLPAVSCQNQPAEEKQNRISLNIVALLPLTGDLAFLGDPGKNAIELVKENIEKSFPNLNFIYSLIDSKGSAKEAVSAAKKAVEIDHVKILLTTLTSPSLAVRDSLRGEAILQLAVAIHPDLPIAGSSLIRFCYSGKQEAETLLKAIEGSKEPIGLVVSSDASTDYQVKNLIMPGLGNSGIKVLYTEWFAVGQKDFSNLRALQAKHKAKRILLLGYGSDFYRVLEVLSQTRTMPQMTIYGGIGFAEMGSLSPAFEEANFHLIVPAFALGLSGDRGMNFREQYKKKYGKEPGYDAAFTYDAILILAQVANEIRSTEPARIKQNILGKTFSGVTGELRFQPSGELISPIYEATYKSGGLVPINE